MVTHISRVLNLHQIWEAAMYQAVLKHQIHGGTPVTGPGLPTGKKDVNQGDRELLQLWFLPCPHEQIT